MLLLKPRLAICGNGLETRLALGQVDLSVLSR